MDEELVGMVLCAGLGTRLRPLTDLLPKPAVPLGGLPLVRWSLALLRGAGVRRVVVNVHHRAAEMERAARGAAAALGMELAVSAEPVIAGTGGALRQARPLLRGAGAVLLLNGDVLFDADLPAAIEAHRRGGALATMLLAPMPPGAAYAPVEADAGLAVRRIAGRPGPGGPGLVPWHFTGYHVISPRLLDELPDEPFDCDVNRHVYPPLLDGRVRGHVDRGAWSDLGSPAGYLRANLEVLAGAPRRPRPGADPRAGLSPRPEPGVWAGEGVVVEPGAVLRGPLLLGAGSRVEAGAAVGPAAVVGAGCRVGAGAEVRQAVAWEGTALAPGERLVGAVAAGALRVPAGG